VSVAEATAGHTDHPAHGAGTAPGDAGRADFAHDHRKVAALAALEPLMDKCVHCGFCLTTCPSYLLLGQEMDSPRGRIHMMKAAVHDRLDLDGSMPGHIDTCLGCLACETACPSGVKYAPLIEETRATLERHTPRSAADRLFRQLLFEVLPYPARLRVLALPLALVGFVKRRPGLLALLPPRLRALTALAPDRSPSRDVPEHTAAKGPVRHRVGLLTGCVQRVFFGAVNDATIRVLTAEGCEVVAPRSQGCCGALALHAGQGSEARAFARELIATFDRESVDTIVVNAAGCGSTMKEYGQLLKDDPAWAERARAFSAKVRDVTEVLAALEPVATRHPLALRIAYHDACHLAHGQGVRQQPRALLSAIPQASVLAIAEGDICCGSAGIFNLVQPEMAGALGRRKAGHIADTGADIVVTSNPGCILQIRASQTASQARPVMHIVEVIDASIQGTDAAALTRA
jgi:glycolate oxidase iron-sulfur subunit